MTKLIVDRIQCITSTDWSGDDLYFLVMKFDPSCKVHRVGPNAAWADIEDGQTRNADIVLIDGSEVEHLVAVIDQDDGLDFDNNLVTAMTSVLRLLFALHEPFNARGPLLGMMTNFFANIIGQMRTNDDLLSVQVVTASGVLHVRGQGAEYKITLKAG